MRKILISANCLHTEGGIGGCLYQMILNMYKISNDFELTLLLFDPTSVAYIENLPVKVVLPKKKYDINISTTKLIKNILLLKLPFSLLIHRFLYKFAFRIPLINDQAFSYNPLNDKYDIAISYGTIPSYLASYVAYNVNATQKIAWAHISVDQNHSRKYGSKSILRIKDLKNYSSTLKHFNKIYAVSEGVKRSLLSEIDIGLNVDVFYNFVSKHNIIHKSFEQIDIDKENGCFYLLTVGRLSKEKGIVLLLETAKMIKKAGMKFKWFLLGSVDEPDFIKRYINKHNLSSNIIMMGVVKNPYPYFKMCDLYVHCSYVEGYCTATNEARIMCKPIVSTEVSGADEQIHNMENGIIVHHNSKEISNAILFLIKNPIQIEYFSKYDMSIDFNNDKSTVELRKMLN